MARAGDHEPIGERSDEVRDMHRAIVSLKEEIDAVDGCSQSLRGPASGDGRPRAPSRARTA